MLSLPILRFGSRHCTHALCSAAAAQLPKPTTPPRAFRPRWPTRYTAPMPRRPTPGPPTCRPRAALWLVLFLAAAAVLPACRTVPSYSPFDPPRYAEPEFEDFAALLYFFQWTNN